MSPSVNQPWDKLKTCLVGRSYPPEFYSYIKDPRARAGMERIAQETEEDFVRLSNKLIELGVDVIRTNISDDWKRDHNWGYTANYPSAMIPRDHTMVLGNKLYMPNHDYLEDINVEHMIYAIRDNAEYAKNQPEAQVLSEYLLDLVKPGRGSKGQAAASKEVVEEAHKFLTDGKDFPIGWLMQVLHIDDVTRLCESAATNTIGNPRRVNKKYNEFQDAENWFKEQGGEVVYNSYVNGASTIKCGKDLYFAINNILTYINEDYALEKWQKMFPDYRIHPLHFPGHSDGALAPIKPGCLISIGDPKHTDITFPGWDVCNIGGQGWSQVEEFSNMKNSLPNNGRWWVPGEEKNDSLTDFVETWLNDWVIYVEETVFDVNMLVVDEQNVIVNNYNKDVFDFFEKHGVTGHVINFRHRYFWDGGLHCITTDLDREGERQDFFPERSK